MNSDKNLQDIEAIKQLKAQYLHFGDTKQWDKFAELFTEDFEAIIDGVPRTSKEQPTSMSIKGRDTFIGGMSVLLAGVLTAHQVYLPEIVITSPTTAKGTWG